MTVLSTGGTARVYLNSEKDFKSKSNFAVNFEMKDLEKDLEAAKIANPKEYYLGKKVKVTGTVTLFRGQPQIVVKKLSQIQVVE
jgi:hypothetical protein